MAANPILDILRAAFSQLGVPYVWDDYNPAGSRGGPGSGFDCSGFTMYALHAAGLGVTHNAAAQQSQLPSVGRNGLQPGDLVFMWYPNSRGIPNGTASHVGVYIGGGKMVAASSSGSAVEVQGVDWSAFVGGGDVYRHLGSPDPPPAHRINELASQLGANVTVHGSTAATAAATASASRNGGAVTSGELAGILRGFGLNPSMFDSFIHQAIVNQWSPSEFQANLYGSQEFHDAFPGIFNQDGSLKMTPSEWNQLAFGAGGMQDIANNFGINMNRERIGQMIGDNVSADEFYNRALIFSAVKKTPALQDAVNQVLTHAGEKKLDAQGYWDFLAGKSEARLYDLYESARLTQQGIDLGKNPLRVASQIGAPGTLTDTAALAAQVNQIKGFIGPELAAAGISEADLTLLEGGAPDTKHLAEPLQQLLRNRQGLVGAGQRGGTVGAGLFGAAPEGL